MLCEKSTKKMQASFWISQIFAFVTVFFWSSAYVFTKVALESYSVASLAILRCLVASLCLGLALAVKGGRLPGLAEWPRFFLAGAVGFALYTLAFNKGSLSLNPTTSCIIISTSPIITAFLAQAVFGERPGRAGWLAIGTAFAGILVISLWDGELLVSGGVVWMLAAAVLISLYNVLQRGLSRHFGALEITAYGFFAGTLLLLPFLPEAVEEVRNAPLKHTAVLCFLGIFPSALAYLSWVKALALAPKTGNVSNYMFLTPFLALLLEYFVTGEIPGSGTFAGGAVILAGLAFFVVAGKRQRR